MSRQPGPIVWRRGKSRCGYAGAPTHPRLLNAWVTGREIDFEITTDGGAGAFVARVQPSDVRRLIKEVDEAKELGWLRAGEARWTAVYEFLERVMGGQEYARLRELVADGVDENGYGDGGDARLDEIVDQLLAEAN